MYLTTLLIVAASTLIATCVQGYNPCCSYPCQNGAICMPLGQERYNCDCTGTNYYGHNCETATFIQSIHDWFKVSPSTMHHFITGYSWIWAIINRVSFLQKRVMKYIYISRGAMIDTPVLYESDHEYITMDAYYNMSYYARSLPPVPKDCPTPMGVHGPKKLPPVEEVVSKLFRRKKFIQDNHGTNILFAAFAQHFSHQFFRTDRTRGPGFTLGTEGIDMSQVYGGDEKSRRALRSYVDGKLKTHVFGGEEYPPLMSEAPEVYMKYPPHVLGSDTPKFAVGNSNFGMLPWLLAIATVWIREHNRVCDVLKEDNPTWDDEQLYQTSRMILVGETMKIVVEDYVQHLSQYNFRLTFEPELTHGEVFQFSNRIRIEFAQLYHWHPFIPDILKFGEKEYTLNETIFSVQPLLDVGLDQFFQSLVHQPAGAMVNNNHAPELEPIAELTLTQSRQLRIQSFNRYLRRFGIPPYKSFLELTGDPEIAKRVEELYGDIDAVEFYPGLFLEAPGTSVVSRAMVNIGGPYSVKGLVANPICSPGWWKPSTFGGERGFQIVKTATIRKLICQNLASRCKDSYMAFSVPDMPPWWMSEKERLGKDEL